MKLLTTKAVAEQLEVSPITVIRLVDSGALPAVEVARRKRKRILRFKPESVEKFITSREQCAGK